MQRHAVFRVSFLLALLTLPTTVEAQVCTGSGAIGFDSGPGTINASRNCLNLFWCHDPDVAGVDYELIPAGCDPTAGSCTVRARVPLEFPGNHNNSLGIGYFDSPVKLVWQNSSGGFVGACGNAGARIQVDEGDAWIERSFSCGGGVTGDVYDLDIRVCDAVSGCTRTAATSVDLTNTALEEIYCPPPIDWDCDSCTSCVNLGGGGGGGGWAPGAGGGGGGGGPGSGPGALLAYRAFGVGAAGNPTPPDWPLGRFWVHSYAQTILTTGNPDRVLLLTDLGSYRTFDDSDSDGTFDIASPASEKRTLTSVASGWELRDLEGTVDSFDSTGRWSGRADRHGNTTTATYSGTQLTNIAFPDGRSETFGYHPDGKLATITEIGVDGVSSLIWAYTWTGDDLSRIDRPDGTALLYRYDDPSHPGAMTRSTLLGTDGVSERVTAAWEYDGHGNVTKLWRGAPDFASGVDRWQLSFDDPTLPTVTTVTDPLGNISTRTWVADRTSRQQKAKLDRLDGDCPLCGTSPTSQFVYGDPLNPYLPTQETDALGHVTLMDYDGHGQLVRRVEANGTALERETTWTYDANFPTLITTRSEPSVAGFPSLAVVTRVYDATGKLQSRTEDGFEAGAGYSLTTTFGHNAGGSLLTTDPPGNGTADVTTKTYDATRGNGFLVPASRDEPLVGTTTYGHDPWNRMIATTDPNGLVTETEYDALDRTTRRIERGATPADDLVTEFRYNVFGDLFQTVLPMGNVVEYGYDAAGRQTHVERKADDLPTTRGERRLFTLDNSGHRIAIEKQRFDSGAWVTLAETAFEYSTRCHLDRRIEAPGTPEESVTEFAYDCDGRLEAVWDGNHPSLGQTTPPTTRYSYDALDRRIEIEKPWGGAGGGVVTTTYGYDVHDRETSVTDGEGNVTTYESSDRRLLTEESSQATGTRTWSYDDRGSLVSETDGRGITVTHTRDVLQRTTFTNYPGSDLDITYTYDDPAVPFSKGRLTRMRRAGRDFDRATDRFGRVILDEEFTFAYDKNGNRTEIGYPGDVQTLTTYDFANRPETMTIEGLGGTLSETVVSATTWNPSGPLTSLTLGNGAVETRTYDARYQPDRVTVTGPAGSLLDWDYTVDGVGNPTSIQDLLDPLGNRTYGYQDHQYYTTQGDGPWGTRSWTYDRMGNRTAETRDGVASTWSYTANPAAGNSPLLAQVDRPGTNDDVTYSYDAAGNLTFANTVANGGLGPRFTPDAAGRIRIIRRKFVDLQSAHVYDPRGYLWRTIGHRRVGGSVVRTTVRSRTTADDSMLRFAERSHNDGSPTETLHYAYFAGRPVLVLEQLGGAAPTRRYLSVDAMGTPVLATDGAGSALWSGGFTPFGEDWAGAGAAGIALRFPGQWEDPTWQSSSLGNAVYQNAQRWFGSGTGRYTRPDPLGLAASLNPIAYVEGRPMVFVDPTGEYFIGPDANSVEIDAFDDAMEKLRQELATPEGCKCWDYFTKSKHEAFQGLDWTRPSGPPYLWARDRDLDDTAESNQDIRGRSDEGAPWLHVFVYDDAFRPSGRYLNRCKLASLILHEVGHLARQDTWDYEPQDFFDACSPGCLDPGEFK